MNKQLIVIMLALCLIGSAAEGKKMVEIIAHRGCSYIAPENTLAAIDLAWKLNADAVEIDIYLTSDSQIVLSHDPNTKRTAGVSYNIAKTPLGVLRHLDVGRWKGAEYAGERMPTLSEALATIPKGRRMLVEVKCGPEVVPYFVDVFKKSHKSAGQVAIISFDASVIRAMKAAYPQFEAYLLATPTADNADALIALSREIGADGLDLSAVGALNADYAQKVKDAGLGLYVWTVDDPVLGKRIAEMGADGITTNKPDIMRKALLGD